MKRPVLIALAIALVLVIALVLALRSPAAHASAPLSATSRSTLSSSSPSSNESLSAASSDVRRLHLVLGNFLLAVKDPYRPPLGDNRDITRALTGANRRGLVMVKGDDAGIRDGQLVDRWGTPYWFHPRAPDVIDIVSAGPDRVLFTGDDLGARRPR